MKVSSASWNRLLARLNKIWPVRFEHRSRPIGWPVHPWAPQPGFDRLGRFGIRLVPGLVNGQPAYVNMAFRQAPPETQDRIKNLRKKQGQLQPESNEIIRVPLDEGPFIQPAWRPVDPFDPTRVLPANFRGLGGNKLIFATEVILVTRRTASFGLATYAETGGGAVEATVNVGYRVMSGAGFEVQCRENFAPPDYQLNPADIFFNRYQEPAETQVKIGTIFGAVEPGYGNVLSQRWQIAGQPDLYHNLAYHDRGIPPSIQTAPLRFVTPLGLGLANAPAYLAANNQTTADALSFFAPRRTGGLFHAV